MNKSEKVLSDINELDSFDMHLSNNLMSKEQKRKDVNYEHKIAVHNYSSNGYKEINNHLRHSDPIPDASVHHINKLKELTRNSVKHSFYSYRGINDEHSNFKEGDLIKDHGFTSTSLDKNVAHDFSSHIPNTTVTNHKGTIFKIHVNKGHKGSYIAAHNSNFQNEHEFVLHPGTTFRVGKHETDKTNNIVNLHIHSQED